jgi:hypothetical protein
MNTKGIGTGSCLILLLFVAIFSYDSSEYIPDTDENIRTNIFSLNGGKAFNATVYTSGDYVYVDWKHGYNRYTCGLFSSSEIQNFSKPLPVAISPDFVVFKTIHKTEGDSLLVLSFQDGYGHLYRNVLAVNTSKKWIVRQQEENLILADFDKKHEYIYPEVHLDDSKYIQDLRIEQNMVILNGKRLQHKQVWKKLSV